MTDDAPAILIVDDDELTAELYQAHLSEAGFEHIIVCADSRDVMGIVLSTRISTVLLDLNMPYISGQELLDRMRAETPDIAIIVLTSEDRVDTAVDCMKKGALDYIAKPVEPGRLVNAVRLAATIRELRDEVTVLASEASELKHPEVFSEIVTASPVMLRIFSYIEAVAGSPKPVLVTGESGTGKELVAKAIHSVSGRTGEFVAVNVSGLDDVMFSDTLFGHIRGAYTGADTTRRGLVDRAADGTLFLDEIGDLPIGAQVKLLRLLQENEYYQLGSDVPERARVRVLAATNADLAVKQRDGSFRKDLYFRLMSHRVHLPPLRDRVADIPLLVERFLADAASSMGRRTPTVPKELYTFLATYDFPGNIRELQAVTYDALSRHVRGVLSIETFIAYVEHQRSLSGVPGGGNPESSAAFSFRGAFPTLKEVEDYFVAEALRRAQGNQSVAARLLGISQSTLSRRQHAEH